MQLKLPSVPAYSFPKTSRERLGDDIVPGPGQYDEDRYGELSTHSRQPRTVIPRAGLSASIEKEYNPGPADYDTNRSSLTKKGQYVIGASKREVSLGNFASPGPGAYEISQSTLSKQGIAIVKTGRENGQLNQAPGPGNYDTNKSTFGKKGIAVLKGQGHGDHFNKEMTPGPLDYDPYTFEERSRSKIGIKIAQSGRDSQRTDNGPGPASYEASYSSLSKKGYAAAKTGRNIFSKDEIPGPGNYETSVSSLSRRGLARLGPLKNNGLSIGNIPGPADYEPYIQSRSTKGLTIPRSGRKNLQDVNGPGPAAYDSASAYDKLTKKVGLGFAAVKAKSHATLDGTPGPAYYDALKSSLTRKGHTTFPKSGRDGPGANPTPGPADYETGTIFEKDRKKDITIPKAGRGSRNDVTPGPGQYDFIPSVPDVPTYLQKRH